MPKPLLSLLACSIAALALVACGGDSESDEEQITTAITTAVETTDPADCATYSTQAFLEQSEGAQGKEALESCEEDVKDTSNDPDSVTVTAVEVDGDAATAEVAFEGGGLDQQTVVVSLVDEDGWKLDSIDSFATFNRDAFVASIEEGFEMAELSDEQMACVSESLEAAGDQDLEDVVLSGSEDALIEIVSEC